MGTGPGSRQRHAGGPVQTLVPGCRTRTPGASSHSPARVELQSVAWGGACLSSTWTPSRGSRCSLVRAGPRRVSGLGPKGSPRLPGRDFPGVLEHLRTSVTARPACPAPAPSPHSLLRALLVPSLPTPPLPNSAPWKQMRLGSHELLAQGTLALQRPTGWCLPLYYVTPRSLCRLEPTPPLPPGCTGWDPGLPGFSWYPQQCVEDMTRDRQTVPRGPSLLRSCEQTRDPQARPGGLKAT